MDEIDRILRNSTKAELMEILGERLVGADKAVIILITDKESGKYLSQVMTLGLTNTYEAYGILDVARQDLEMEDF